MMQSMKSPSVFVAPIVFFFFCHASEAQHPAPTLDRQQAAMSKLRPLVGQWKGSGWIEFGPRRFDFQSSETFAVKAGGLAIVVEGLHHVPMPDGTRQVVHNAVAMINFDAESRRYRFATQLANGQAGTYDATVTQDGDFEWTIPETPLGKMVYTITFQKDGEYLEIGELVPDSGDRKKFFEMNLRRVNTAEE